MESSDLEEFPSIDEAVLDEIIDFVHPSDLYLFNRDNWQGEKNLSKYEFQIHLINRQFSLSNEEIQPFYKRVEDLTKLNSTLEKFLAESNEQRYTKFMDTFFYSGSLLSKAESIKKNVENTLENFEKYKISTLYDFNRILKGYKLIVKLKEHEPFLKIFKDLVTILNYSKNMEVPVTYCILALASGVKYSREALKVDPRVEETLFYNVVRNKFDMNIEKMLTNVFVKNQYALDPCDKLLMLLILGQNSEKSSDCVINLLKEELISLTLLNIQKYVDLKREFGSGKRSSSNKENLSVNASLVIPDLFLIVVSKILSEFISFFQNLTLRLNYESKITHPNHVRNLTGIKGMDELFSDFNKVDYYLYYRRSLDLFVNKFEELVDETFDILYRVVSVFNFNAVKDRNDVLKVSLIILYYKTLQNVIKRPKTVANSADLNYKQVCVDQEVVEILKGHLSKIFKNLEKEDKSEGSKGLENLEQVISKMLMEYSNKFAEEVRENISILTEEVQRLAIHPFMFEDMELDKYSKVFKNFVNKGEFIHFSNFKFSRLNPFLGWTPNSNFASVNVSSQLFKTFKTDDNNYERSIESKSNQEENKQRNLNNCRLVRDYGGVYTFTSREMLRSFENYLKTIMVDERNCLELIESYTRLLDEFIYKNIKSCQMEDCVIENLKKFNTILRKCEQVEERTISISTCDTQRMESSSRTQMCELSRLSSVVNSVESSFTLLESLVPLINKNRNKQPEFTGYLEKYYKERCEVVAELRLMLYHIEVYNLLRPKLPGIRILEILRMGNQVQIEDDFNKTFKEFEKHLRVIREFLESADSGSFPAMVKVMLWDSIINVVKDSVKHVSNFVNKEVNSDFEKNIKKNYLEIINLSREIRSQYVYRIRDDHRKHRTEIASMSTYYNLVEGLVNSLNGA